MNESDINQNDEKNVAKGSDSRYVDVNVYENSVDSNFSLDDRDSVVVNDSKLVHRFVNYISTNYTEWRQKKRNGILPIGISNVGKSTFLATMADFSSATVTNFNRTLVVKHKKETIDPALRKELTGRDIANYFKKIDVPGEAGEKSKDWVKAYIKHAPKVLVIIVDNDNERGIEDHIEPLNNFMKTLEEKKKSLIGKFGRGFRNINKNLKKIIFVLNDKNNSIDYENYESFKKNFMNENPSYDSLMADLHDLTEVNVLVYCCALKDPVLSHPVRAKPLCIKVVEILSRK